MKINNRIYIFVVLLTAVFFFAIASDGYRLNYTSAGRDGYTDRTVYPKGRDASKVQEGKKEKLGEFSSVDEAINELGISVHKRKDYSDNSFLFSFIETEEAELEITCYQYDNKTGEMYKINDSSGYISDIRNFFYDGYWYDYSFVEGLMQLCLEDFKYIPGQEDYDDIYYGVWIGDEIKNISFKEGKFEYSLLDEQSSEQKIYLWTYELTDSKELLSSVTAPEEYADSVHYNYDTKDVKKLLGVKCKLTIDMRIIIYWILTLALSVLFVFVVRKTFLLNNNSEASTMRVLMWIISILLCVIVTSLISYYISNPRLFFGTEGINKYMQKLIGFKLPNAY
ncbi:hypothetical protein D6856_13925 [Butyrivibrio sp. XB500-5]|uniref:hypothetical protein n=1 Tax=Butyrivibrio sp. XB500-5 TaxID=2364880 RepID=UPI000EA8D9E9|nr:hypothetical protein [Butyrivibrio sp. XB500-5]RKM57749.1 hypothetical protein D6856_13925 [Butyrivibrio sp. XB500-5]